MTFVHVARMVWLLVLTACLLFQNFTSAFSIARNDNLAVYWGQDSAGNQQRLSFYCNDDTIDIIPLAFLYIFFGKGGQPVVDFANICSQGSNTFPGTDLADCSFLAGDIKQCQAKGKIVTLSLGGATSQVGFNSDSQAAGFAVNIWNMFLGGNGGMRPFGDAILDGVDLDIESGPSAHYATFVNTLRSLAKGAPKRYYVTGAPQCPLPDQELGNALDNAFFDAVYVQFYNNFCETSVPSEFNLAAWDQWAKTQSPNPNIKVYLGAPASALAAGNGFVSSQTLASVALGAQKQFSSFGGVMLWDADAAHTNNRYDAAVKKAISNRSGVPSPAFGPTPTPTPSDQDPRVSGRVRPSNL
ncbi:glycoside hydrolase [Phlegmacium glaucopus]|nr:glycoside hydrolase [Phlegmacium glaucopus]